MKQNKFFREKVNIFYLLTIIIPTIIALWSILSGNIPFWYDNARDLLSAWDNLSNPTLIGPTSGISGIFYGPYWIWLLSIATLISKDPRIVDLIVGGIPYLIFFPGVLFMFSKKLDKYAIISVWLFFIFNIGFSYVTNLWNPHVAPLLTLLLIYALTNFEIGKEGKSKLLNTFSIGILVGLIINFHIAFGIGIFLGSLFYLAYKMIEFYKKDKAIRLSNLLSTLPFFLLGLFITFIPFLVFETRHGFNQIKTFTASFTTFGSNVTVEGLSPILILELFFSRAGQLFGITAQITYLLLAGLFFYSMYLIKGSKLRFNPWEKNLAIILTSLASGILALYLLARNPIWAYHFIGVEVIFVILFIFLLTKLQLLRKVVVALAIVLLAINTYTFFDVKIDQKQFSDSLHIKEKAIRTIIADGGNDDYSFVAYSSSIYMYEYSYLMKWLASKDFSFDPGSIDTNKNTIYLLVPKKRSPGVEDFINNKTNEEKYKTTKTWEFSNDIIILRRDKELVN